MEKLRQKKETKKHERMEGKEYEQEEMVQRFLEVISDYNDQRQEHDKMIDMIEELLDSTFIISSPDGNQRLSGNLLFQCLWRTCSWMKPLDYTAHISGSEFDEKEMTPEVIDSAESAQEKLLRDGLNTVLDRGGYIDCLTSGMGSFWSLLLFGDDLIMVGMPEEDDPFPIEFSNISLKNVYVNNSALGVRVRQKGRSARQMVVIFKYTRGEFDEKWPDWAGVISYGAIPRNFSEKDYQETSIQTHNKEEDEMEVAYGYDLNERCFSIFAGPDSTVLEMKMGDEYPFIMEDLNGRKKAYIPIIQHGCFPAKGFWNKGLGHILYKLTMLTKQMMNMEAVHLMDNVLPIELISTNYGKSSAFFKSYSQAVKMREQGHRGMVVVERAEGDPNASAVTAQTLLTQNLFSEWQAFYAALIQEVNRFGINIDEIDSGGNKTATEIISLEESSKALIRQIGEWNGSEDKMAIEITMNHIKEFVSIKDKTPLDLTTRIETVNGTRKVKNVTLGNIAELLKKRRCFVRMDLRSGAILSNAMKYTRLSAAAAFFPQGTPEFQSLGKSAADFFELDLPGAAPQPPQSAPGEQVPQEQGKTAEPQGVPASSTDRQELNPNVAVRGPAI